MKKKVKLKEESFRLSFINPYEMNYFNHVWHQISPIVTKALPYADGKYTLEDIYINIINKQMQLWVVSGSDEGPYSICITKMVNYPQKKVLNIMFCAGKHLPVWVHYIESLKEFARNNQCDAIEEYGRQGWSRYLEKWGFETLYTVCRYNLTTDEGARSLSK